MFCGLIMTDLRLCRIVTTPLTLNTLLREQIQQVADVMDCTTVCGHSPDSLDYLPASVRHHSVSLSKALSPQVDIIGLWQMFRLFREQQFDIVHTSTPKAGLVGMLASYLARVPIRIHTYTGQPWVEIKGWQGWILKNSDKLIGKLATHCFTDSESQKQFLIDETIISSQKLDVIGSGSIAGVDLDRFNIGKRKNSKVVSQQKAALGIPAEALVLTFVGRIVQDKGIVELVEAFTNLVEAHANVYLLVIGPIQTLQSTLPNKTLEALTTHPQIKSTGFVNNPEDYLAITDVFCLPSYREGFGSVVIEAAAMGVPTVATRIPGLVDAVVDQQTGLLVEKKSTVQLTGALIQMIRNMHLRETLGQAAYTRACTEFSSEYVNQRVIDAYQKLWEPYNR